MPIRIKRDAVETACRVALASRALGPRWEELSAEARDRVLVEGVAFLRAYDEARNTAPIILPDVPPDRSAVDDEVARLRRLVARVGDPNFDFGRLCRPKPAPKPGGGTMLRTSPELERAVGVMRILVGEEA